MSAQPAHSPGAHTPARPGSTTEYAVLGVLAEQPSHGFAIAKAFTPDREIGRVFAVRRPLVYRALDRLVADRFAAPIATEPGAAGPQRTIHTVTEAGHLVLGQWLAEPVGHVRDLRVDFLVKLSLLSRRGEPAGPLIAAQRGVLSATFDALDQPESTRLDHVDLWRRHIALAAASYLDELADRWE